MLQEHRGGTHNKLGEGSEKEGPSFLYKKLKLAKGSGLRGRRNHGQAGGDVEMKASVVSGKLSAVDMAVGAEVAVVEGMVVRTWGGLFDNELLEAALRACVNSRGRGSFFNSLSQCYVRKMESTVGISRRKRPHAVNWWPT